jgi:hypothetical protein
MVQAGRSGTSTEGRGTSHDSGPDGGSQGILSPCISNVWAPFYGEALAGDRHASTWARDIIRLCFVDMRYSRHCQSQFQQTSSKFSHSAFIQVLKVPKRG